MTRALQFVLLLLVVHFSASFGFRARITASTVGPVVGKVAVTTAAPAFAQAKALPLAASTAAPMLLSAWYENDALKGIVGFFAKGPGLLLVPVVGGIGIAGFIAGFIFFGSQPEEDQ